MLYIDENEAMKRLGSKALYMKLLKRFLSDTSYSKLKESLELGDIKNAQFAAHTIKGMAANLSLITLFEEAAKADIMFKNNESNEDVIQTLDEVMEGTISAIEDYLCG